MFAFFTYNDNTEKYIRQGEERPSDRGIFYQAEWLFMEKRGRVGSSKKPWTGAMFCVKVDWRATFCRELEWQIMFASRKWSRVYSRSKRWSSMFCRDRKIPDSRPRLGQRVASIPFWMWLQESSALPRGRINLVELLLMVTLHGNYKSYRTTSVSQLLFSHPWLHMKWRHF